VTVVEPAGDVRLLHRDADYDDRARYRHLLAQHRQKHEVINRHDYIHSFIHSFTRNTFKTLSSHMDSISGGLRDQSESIVVPQTA